MLINWRLSKISSYTGYSDGYFRWNNGTPASSWLSTRSSMLFWRNHERLNGLCLPAKPIPTNFTGVTVSLDALDPNGNNVHIGNATSDENGLYYYTWTTPNIPGSYLITVTFAGTNGYWGSNAQTAMTVQSAPSTAATPTSTPTSAAPAYFVPAIAGLFVLIIIVLALVVLLMLRKRP